MDLEDKFFVGRGRGRRSTEVDIAFFAGADARAQAIECIMFQMGVKGEIVKTTICEAVAVIYGLSEICLSSLEGFEPTFSVLRTRNEVCFC